MRKLRTQEEIMATWKGDFEKPLVSICCTAFNHEPYIEDALEGFLIQETDFSFEILIHDDASTDKTADIIREYEAKYPKIIKPIYQKENQYSQGKKPSRLNYQRALGEYIALCEGDDFWTDKNKLQIQISFLNTHPDYVISGHDAYIVDENANKIKGSKLPDSQKKDFSSEDLMCGQVWVLTLSWVFRNILKENPPESQDVKNGDSFTLSLLGKYGKSKYHSDIKPACYRVHSGGIWSRISVEDKRDAQINTWFRLYSYHKRVGNIKASEAFFYKLLLRVLTGMPLSMLIRELLVRLFYLRQIKNFIKTMQLKFRT